MNEHVNHNTVLPKKEDFHQNISGKETDLFFLQNEHIYATITNYGARIISLHVKQTNGNWADVIVGFSTLNDYLNTKEIYHGAIIGRYANRIAKGQMDLNGQRCQLAINNGPNHLHGGPRGFHDQVWDVVSVLEDRVTLHYRSHDGEEGYPSNLDVTVSYILRDNDLQIEFNAITDQETVLNLTNHSYFNLNGQGSGSIYDHELYINANGFTPIDETLIPTGEIALVSNTPFDFRQPKKIGLQINDHDQQIQFGNGYDHNFVLNKTEQNLELAARAIGDKTGITLEVYTTEPGLQFYSGNFMEGAHEIKGGGKDNFRTAFCLETQHFPDSPNHTNFPSTTLLPGQNFQSKTIFRFLNSF